MPFKARMKRAFGRTSSNASEASSTLSKTKSRKDSNIYQPGEPMPRLKYRQPPEKKHKEHLESFTFAGNRRRNSLQSNYSPMGSKWPSRNPSAVDLSTYGYGRRHPPPNALIELDLSTLSISDRKDSEDSKAVQHVENVSDTSSVKTVEIASPVSSMGSMAPDHRPFTEADLHQALGRSTSGLQVS